MIRPLCLLLLCRCGMMCGTTRAQKMTRLFSMFLLFGCGMMCMTARAEGIRAVRFERVSAKRGAPLRCGVTCGQDPLCTGYMSTPGLQHDCTTLTDGTLPGECFAAASDPSAKVCYGKVGAVGIASSPPATSTAVTTSPDVLLATDEPEPCVESVRQSRFGVVCVSYHGRETMYEFESPGACFFSQPYSSMFWSEMYLNFPQDIRDIYKVMVSFDHYLVVLDGDGMVRTYSVAFPNAMYQFVPGSLKTIQEEYGPSVPESIDAGDMEDSEMDIRGITKTIYLISGDTVYELNTILDYPPWTYSFVQKFTLLDPGNPFQGSGMVPGAIHALLVYGSEVLAFTADAVYLLDRQKGVWAMQTPVLCPE